MWKPYLKDRFKKGGDNLWRTHTHTDVCLVKQMYPEYLYSITFSKNGYSAFAVDKSAVLYISS